MRPHQPDTRNARAARWARLTCGYTLTPAARALLSPVMPVHNLSSVTFARCGCQVYAATGAGPAACPIHGRAKR